MKTTKKQFEEFKTEFKKYQTKFELNNWKVYFFHKKLESSFANISIDLVKRVSAVSFSSELTKEATGDLDIPTTAKHEAIHLMLGELSVLGNSRFISDSELESAEESLVRKLENLI